MFNHLPVPTHQSEFNISPIQLAQLGNQNKPVNFSMKQYGIIHEENEIHIIGKHEKDADNYNKRLLQNLTKLNISLLS